MRFIPTRVHGVIDYLWGVLFASSPWLFGYGRGGAETWVAVAFGAGAILYSLLTDYEVGVFRVLSMRAHLVLDVLGGAVLAASPWLFGFADLVRAPHLGFGLFSVVAGLITETVPRKHAPARTTEGGTLVHPDRERRDLHP
ncbi:MAG TPA: hypothetical protein VE685_20755 [Thermoanaerobaculia bacterium]|nr:hypothetical protein [Thermoanaerobaculia bacterium]